jgi:Rrf2 family iron-sulfur cluster assembly transcriptional regulator
MRLMGRTAVQVLKALLELAQEPETWRSVKELAQAQALPEPYLEQLLLRLRRAGVLEARRGRNGGYRLACPPAELPLGRVLDAAGAWPGAAGHQELGAAEPAIEPATERVAALLQQRLNQALNRELQRLTLQELLFDLRSARAALSEEGGLILG